MATVFNTTTAVYNGTEKNGQTTKQDLRVVEGPSTLSERTIYWWVEAFEDGDENIKDDSLLAKLLPAKKS
ncbi:4281_t:CDS:2 [Paraglomus brasilianum]|uniref:4281_t:CDS:1 n=1 Tax=Paraglomus brasilianum TaxID=144538 RepID=A0A9N9A4Q8_9GLOM|nr:4281_t:CDS:2 [Paraglomus brasilianum]